MDSTVNYGQEYGANLIKIAKKLLKNQNLCKLLINTDKDPLNTKLHPDIEDTMELFGKNVRIIPLIDASDETTASKIVVLYAGGTPSNVNPETEQLQIFVYIYCPYEEWTIVGEQLRPFGIISEIRKSLQDVRINGLGEISYDGFEISSLTGQMGSYLLRFTINAFK